MADTRQKSTTTSNSNDETEDCVIVATDPSPLQTPTRPRRRQQAFGRGGSSKKTGRTISSQSAPEARHGPQPLPTPEPTPTKIRPARGSAEASPEARPALWGLSSSGNPEPSSRKRLIVDGDALDETAETSDEDVNLPSPSPPRKQRRKEKGLEASRKVPASLTKSLQQGLLPTPEASPTRVRKAASSPPEAQPSTRPVVDGRSVSDPSPLGHKDRVIAPRDIDAEIESLIKSRITELNPGAKDSGVVYVIPATVAGKLVVKVGFTTSSPAKRTQSIKSKCKNINFHPPDRAEELPAIRHFRRVEKLAHAELKNFWYDFPCGCGMSHREYFDVEEETALRIVRRWIRFAQATPWHDDGDLKEEWKHRLTHRTRCGRSETEKDHGKRHQRWKRFVDARPRDWIIYELRMMTPRLWHHRWLVVCVLESLVIAYLAPASCWSFLLLGYVALFVGILLETNKVRSPTIETTVSRLVTPQFTLSRSPTDELERRAAADSERPKTVVVSVNVGGWPDEKDSQSTEGSDHGSVRTYGLDADSGSSSSEGGNEGGAELDAASGEA